MTMDPAARLRANTQRVGDCLEWTGDRMWAGYGRIRVSGKDVRTHRLAWTLVHGPIPDGLMVLHHCDNRACVNVEHLFLGTNTDNMRDMIAKGRKVPSGGVVMGTSNAAAKMDEEKVRRLRELAAQGVARKKLALMFGISYPTVRRIIQREYWPHVA